MSKRNRPKGKGQTPMPAPQSPTPRPGAQGVPVPTPPSRPPDDRSLLDALLQTLETERKRPAIVYYTSNAARLSMAAEMPMYDQLRALGGSSEVDVVLVTNGGDTEAPWRHVSLIREFCDRFSVLLPYHALSAGTLFALGADEIVMSRYAALGPIDPSRTHPLLPRREGAAQPEPISVQDMRHAMQFIREAAGAGAGMPYTPEAMAQIFTALFEKIHPLAIGAIEQSYALAKLIGVRCLSTHMDPATDEAKINAIVDRLCDEFKSHSYQIGRAEAKKVGLKVVDPSEKVEAAMMQLYTFYAARPIGPFGGAVTPGAQVMMQIAWMDSARLKMRVEQQLLVEPTQTLKNLGDQWVPY